MMDFNGPIKNNSMLIMSLCLRPLELYERVYGYIQTQNLGYNTWHDLTAFDLLKKMKAIFSLAHEIISTRAR